MKKYLSIHLSGLIFILGINLGYAQAPFALAKKESLSVRSGEGDADRILEEIRSQKPVLNLDRDVLRQLGDRQVQGLLVYKVKQGGKVVFESERIPVTLNQRFSELDLFSQGLEESMINTWEKQGFIRRQVGRIDDPEAKGGNLPAPKSPQDGKSGGTTSGKSSGNLKPISKTEKQGFIRRQVGRIPKSQYEVEVTLQGPNDRGNSQPSTYFIQID
ncbi:hypothetical protein [Algoriphagus taiwanensis]|uniref:POTRA domain-containing protein n=1 Tax=Algoriphagus taiwanensis TaxID=1445656 RepID=A0ABQ6Q067_9BACT|nr:hypothetical protein Ataiwa_15390 [Algoriphagus taiwanensis]